MESEGVSVQGTGPFTMGSVLVAGATGPSLQFGDLNAGPDVFVEDSSILDGRGPAVVTGGYVNFVRSEVVGNVAEGADRAVLLAGPGADLQLRASVVFGNVARSGADAVVVGPVRFSGSALLGNTAEQAPVARLGYGGRGFYDPGDGLTGFFVFRDSVVARNRVVAESPSDPAPSPEGELPDAGGVGCAHDSPQPYWERPVSGGPDLALGSEPLLLLDTDVGFDRDGDFVSATSWFVENQTREDHLIEVLAGGENLTTQLLSNTFAGNGVERLVSVVGSRSSGEVTVLRNLVDEVASGVEVDGSARVVVTNNVFRSQPEHLLPANSTGLDGPDFVVGPILWRDASAVRGLSSCARFELACASAGGGACESWRTGELPCASNSAAGYVPDPEWLASAGISWTWETSFFEAGNDDGWLEPGATGWQCEPRRGTADQTVGPGGEWGDGDGFPDAVDCDNDDPNTVPEPPAQNGVDTDDCVRIEGNCYVCPPGTETSGDDDDSLPYGPDDQVLVGSCVGCGVTIGGRGVALLLLLAPLGLFRRRRSTG